MNTFDPSVRRGPAFREVHDLEGRLRRYMPLVVRAAQRQWERLGRRVDQGELVAAGAMALLRAAERHDDRRASFGHHVRRRVRWAMQDVARRRLGRQQAESELVVSSVEAPDDLVTSDDHSPEEQVIHRDLVDHLGRALSDLDDKQRRLVERHYLDGEPFSVVADELGISTFAVCRLHRRTLDTLERALRPLRPPTQER